jgi:hypothetical protein
MKNIFKKNYGYAFWELPQTAQNETAALLMWWWWGGGTVLVLKEYKLDSMLIQVLECNVWPIEVNSTGDRIFFY